MTENFFFDSFTIGDLMPGPSAQECCYQGRIAPTYLQRAAELQGEPGFEHISSAQVEFLADRCRVVNACQYSQTGKCALRVSGLYDIF